MLVHLFHGFLKLCAKSRLFCCCVGLKEKRGEDLIQLFTQAKEEPKRRTRVQGTREQNSRTKNIGSTRAIYTVQKRAGNTWGDNQG